MFQDPLFILVIVACHAVFGVLMTGVIGFAKGGEFNRKYANKIMRLRIALQFLAVVLFMLFLYLRASS
ncbi:MAG: twin transmembrane helix small protein [Paracoccaceae bacterium]